MAALESIQLLGMDFDGTLTDGIVYFSETGEEMVACSRKDSLGLTMLKRAGIAVHVISKETNIVVAKRCEKMGIPYTFGVEDSQSKLDVLTSIRANLGLLREQVAYMGDDLNDIACLKYSAVSFCPRDAHPVVRKIVHHVTEAGGGRGAVREVCEKILQAKNIDLRS